MGLIGKLNERVGSTLLAKVSGIDLKTTGPTTLFTGPSGKKFIVTDIVLRMNTVSGFITPATMRVGVASAYTEWLAATALPAGLNSADLTISLGRTALNLVQKAFAAGTTLALDVTVGATGTTVTADAYVFGYLI